LEIAAHLIWRFDLVAASIILGVGFAATALPVALRRFDGWGLFASAALLALAIVSHHFTAMGSIGIIPDPLREVPESALSATAIAIAIAGVALAIIAMSAAGVAADHHIATATTPLRQRIGQLTQANSELIQDTDAKLRENH